MIGAHDPSLLKMNEWMNGSPDANPFKRAEKFMVSTDISSVIQQNADTWQVDWTETTRTRDGALVGTVPYRGLITVYGAPDLSDYRTTISSEPTRNLCPRLFLVEANVMKPSFFIFLAVSATAAF